MSELEEFFNIALNGAAILGYSEEVHLWGQGDAVHILFGWVRYSVMEVDWTQRINNTTRCLLDTAMGKQSMEVSRDLGT